MRLVPCQKREPTVHIAALDVPYSHCLLGLMVVGVEPVRRKLLDVGFSQAARLGLPQALGQVQQGLTGSRGEKMISTLRWRRL